MMNRLFSFGAVLFVAALSTVRPALAQQVPSGWLAANVEPVGYSELDGRPAFKLAIKEVNGRWYLYMGHLWHHGWTIVEVTDPKSPKVIKFIPYESPNADNSWTIQMDVHGNRMITNAAAAGFEQGDPKKPHDTKVLIWDISDPVNPKLVGEYEMATHRNALIDEGTMYLAATPKGFTGNINIIADISDPKNPKELSRFWLPGQNEAAGETLPEPGIAQHGPADVEGNTAYIGMGSAGATIVDVTDETHPKLIGRLDFSPPFKPGMTSAHSVLKVRGKPLLLVNSESGPELCEEPLNFAAVVDVKDPSKPRLMSLLPVPEPPDTVSFTDFCDKGGRFGPHNTNNNQHSPDVEPQGDLVYLTYFNAGLRIYDISKPTLPKEVGWFIPAEPQKRYGPYPQSKLVVQTEDVLVDRRGYIYITGKNEGLWILRYTGPNPASSR